MNAKTMLPVGTLLQGGKYRIERYLSSGGFGNTYVATNLEFEEQVAIKEFFMRGINERDDDSVSVSVSNQSNTEQFFGQREKFKKEARRLRRLKEAHIVAVHDLFEENGTAYYVMDFINGESVSDRLKRTQQPISETEALNILRQVLDALAVTHSHGIYHLDIKPANIMLDTEGRTLLIDFGASKQSKQEGGATTSTGLCYTPGYAPIEQMEQSLDKFGPWTDFYALGATLYYMLTLRQLPSPADLLENDEAVLPMPDISQNTRQLVRRMMCPIRSKRPQNVEEVRALMLSAAAVTTSPASTANDEATMIMTPQQPQPKPKIIEQPKLQMPQPAERKSSGFLVGGVVAVIAALIVGVIGVVAFFLLDKQRKGGLQNVIGQIEDFVPSQSEPLVFTINGVSFKMIPINDSVYIGETEVTQELWASVMGDNPSGFKGPKRPVEKVCWTECANFCNELTEQLLYRQDKKGVFTLPTRAEWMIAANGYDENSYSYSGSNNINDVAWYVGNSGKQTHDVAQKQPNVMGFYDMSGNVWEWCNDGPDDETSYYMGGSGGSEAEKCTVTSSKSASFQNTSFADLGFRLALRLNREFYEYNRAFTGQKNTISSRLKPE